MPFSREALDTLDPTTSYLFSIRQWNWEILCSLGCLLESSKFLLPAEETRCLISLCGYDFTCLSGSSVMWNGVDDIPIHGEDAHHPAAVSLAPKWGSLAFTLNSEITAYKLSTCIVFLTWKCALKGKVLTTRIIRQMPNALKNRSWMDYISWRI